MVIFKNGKFLSENGEQALLFLQSGFGKKEKNAVILHPLEAAYLCDTKLAEIKFGGKNMDVAQIISKMKIKAPKSAGKLPPAGEQYLIYKFVRSGGRVIRFSPNSPHYWRVHARGVGREQEKAQILLRLTSPDWKASLASLEAELSVARQLRQELVLSFVCKGQPVFIKVNKFSLD